MNDLQDYLNRIVEASIASDSSFADIDARHMSQKVYVLVEGANVSSQNYGDIWPIEVARYTWSKVAKSIGSEYRRLIQPSHVEVKESVTGRQDKYRPISM